MVMVKSLAPWVLGVGFLCYLEKNNVLRLTQEDDFYLHGIIFLHFQSPIFLNPALEDVQLAFQQS